MCEADPGEDAPVPSLTRRGLLLAAATTVVLAGCRDKTSTVPHVPTVDEQAREAAGSAERGAADEYAIVLAAYPALAARLTPLADHHARHVAVLVHPASASPSPSPSSSASPAGSTPALALRRLQEVEQRLSATHLAALSAVSPELALLLASRAASAAANAAELGRRG